MSEIIFEVTEDEVDGGYSASAIGYGIHTQGDSMEEVPRNVREAVECYFDDTMERPGMIRLCRPRAPGKPSASRLPLASQRLLRVFPNRSRLPDPIPSIESPGRATWLPTLRLQ